MYDTPTNHATAPNEWRTTVSIATLVSTVAATVALSLHWFLGVDEGPIVLATLAAASVVGWRQPTARLHVARVRPVASGMSRAG
jgi:hypothetical protein